MRCNVDINVSKAISKGLMEMIPFGGHCISISIDGANELWRNVQSYIIAYEVQ